MVRRRAFLAAVAAAGVGGCTALLEDDVRLGGILLSNDSLERQSVAVRVEYEGEEAYSTELELEPAEERDDGQGVTMAGEFLDPEWPDEAGQYVLEARVLGDEPASARVGDEATHADVPDDETCFVGHVQVSDGYVSRIGFDANRGRDRFPESFRC